MKDWIVQKFLLKYVKGFLDKLPANGLKVAFGIALVILHELNLVYGGTPYGAMILWVINFINGLGGSPDTVLNISLVTLIIGAIHKSLKLLGLEKQNEELKDQIIVGR